MSEANENQVEVASDSDSAAEARGEWIKFGILALVLLVTVLAIALLRPLIFGRIVPAVLGEGQPVAPLVNSESEAETIKPESSAEEADEPAKEPETNEAEPTVDDGAVSVEEPEPEEPADFPTAVPSQTHTVQAGETLTAIARRYGVTVQAIVSANSISNPDRVTVGTRLLIPEAGNQ